MSELDDLLACWARQKAERIARRAASTRAFDLHAPDVRKVPVYIYALTEPETGEVRYVGKSDRPEARVASHRARSGAARVREWCDGLARRGVGPRLVVLFAVLPGHDAAPFEREFIARHDGPRLLNYYGSRKQRKAA